MSQSEEITDQRNARANLDRARHVKFAELVEQDDCKSQREKNQAV
jgi:hypothetical protein